MPADKYRALWCDVAVHACRLPCAPMNFSRLWLSMGALVATASLSTAMQQVECARNGCILWRSME